MSDRRVTKMKLLSLAFFAVTFFSSVCWAEECVIGPDVLRCEYLSDPVGLDNPSPRFSWTIVSDARDQMQQSYQIIVSKEKDMRSQVGKVWDSGRVNSDQSLNVVYKGRGLVSGQTYYWKVRVWDTQGRVSKFSKTASFSMGMLQRSDWSHAQWIGQEQEAVYLGKLAKRRAAEDKQFGNKADEFYLKSKIWDLYSFEPKLDPAPLFRRDFSVPKGKKIQSALLNICGLGYFDLRVNGEKISDNINPARSDYDQSLYYLTFDVASNLKDGNNTLGAILGHGFYNMITRGIFSEDSASWTGQPKLLLHLDIQYTDGTRTTVVSDENWKTDSSAILWNDLRAGEVYDARLEQNNWDCPGFSDATWQKAKIVPAPKGELVAQVMPPVRVTKTFKPASMKETSPGIYVYDMGQNFAGWARLKVKGPAGTKVTVSMAEQPQGGDEFIPGEMTRRQQYIYILKGDGQEEVFEPHFSYYGFQYVQIKGFPGTPTLDSLEGCFAHTDLQQVADFECSNPLLNQLQQNLWWSMLSLVHSYPEDCPHREKNGWGDFGTLGGRALVCNFDSTLFFEKWVRDCRDQFETNGAVGNIIPVAGEQGPGDPAWAAAWAICAWYNYLYAGDTKVLADNFESWKKWVAVIKKRQTNGQNNLIVGGIGDWVVPVGYGPYAPGGPEGPSIVTTSYFYHMVNVIAQSASILGYTEDAATYHQWAEQIKKEFNDSFYNPSKKYYETEVKVGFRQSSQAIPIGLGLVPESRFKTLGEHLQNDVYARHDGHLDTGSVGTGHLLDSLSRLDLHDTAYCVVTQTTFPGWLNHIVNYNATTIWENWWEAGSHNHSCFLSVGAYLQEGLAGIRVDASKPGFKNVIVRPGLPKSLDSAQATRQSGYGMIRSSWQRRDGQVYFDVSIPANTTADISVPKDGMGSVKILESGKMIWNGRGFTPTAGLSSATEEADYVTFKAGSGDFKFVVQAVSDSLALGRNCSVTISNHPGIIDMQPGETATFIVRVESSEPSAIARPSVVLDTPTGCRLQCASGKDLAEIAAFESADYLYHITVPASIGNCKVLFVPGCLKGTLNGKAMEIPFTVQVNVLKRVLVESCSLQDISDYSQAVEMVEIQNLSEAAKTFKLNCRLPAGWKALQKISYRAEVSSQLDDNNRPARLYDNIINHSEMNRWHSALSARFPHVIDIYLDQPTDIKQMVLHASSPAVYCKDIRLEYKDANGQWKTCLEKELPRGWVTSLDLDVITDQMKLTILSAVDNMNPKDPHFAQLNEIELLGSERAGMVSMTRIIESGRKEIISLYLNPGNDLNSVRKVELKLDVDGKEFWQDQVELRGISSSK